MCEMEKSVVELHDVSASIMEVLLDFVYTETVNVSVENVQELLPAACLLQLTGHFSHYQLALTIFTARGTKQGSTFVSAWTSE